MAKTKKAKKALGGPFLAAAVFCESVMEDNTKKMSAFGIMDGTNFWLAEDTPADAPSKSQPIAFVQNMLIIFRTGDAGGKHELRLVLEQPDGKRTDILKESIELTPQPYGGCNVRTQAMLKVFTAGVYWIDVILDGKRFTRMPLNVTIRRLPTATSGSAGSKKT